jgi:hypothetical protein
VDSDAPAGALPEGSDALTFDAKNQASGTFFVRLRVDGVDSLLIDYSRQPPQFDETQRVEVA